MQLARDPHDPEHPDAVAAYIGGHHVGHIPHNSAKKWHAVIESLEMKGLPAVCQGEVTGGWHRPGNSTGNYGLIIFATDPPHEITDDDPTVVTTNGRVSIDGERYCQDYLTALAGDRTSTQIVVHLDARHRHRITVHHEGRELGWMTAAMSERYSPFLRELERAGLPLTCIATIRFGIVRYEVSLKLPTGSDLVSAIDELRQH
ncbi:MAG: hypothetical protein R2706_19560 [Acidimicrobiales bacterium]